MVRTRVNFFVIVQGFHFRSLLLLLLLLRHIFGTNAVVAYGRSNQTSEARLSFEKRYVIPG